MIANTTPDATDTTPHTVQLDKYKLLALEALADILRNTESGDRDKRLAAVAILKYSAAIETKPPPATPAAALGPCNRSKSLAESAADAVARHEAHHVISKEALTIAYERGYDDARQSLPAVPIDAVQVAQESYNRMYQDAGDP